MKTLIELAKPFAQALTCALIVFQFSAGFAQAHHPDREHQPVTQRIDVIGPLGNNLRPGHRRVYNRPSYIEGKIAYHIAPTSQEAMSWHRAAHAGYYKNPKCCYRVEYHYFYPKPWEALVTGPRRAALATLDEASNRGASQTAPATSSDLSSPLINQIQTPEREDFEPSNSDSLRPSVDAQDIEALELEIDDVESSIPNELPPLNFKDVPKELEAPSAPTSVQVAPPVDFGIDSEFGLASLEEETDSRERIDLGIDAPEMVVTATGNQPKPGVSPSSDSRKPKRLGVLDKPIYLRFSPQSTFSR